MASVVTFNGSDYVIPATGDTGWGNNVSSYLIAIAAGALQKTGGSFTLSSEIDFGASFGLKSLYYKSRTSNVSSTGIVRLANNSDSISWRNAANSADLSLFVNSSNQLIFNGDIVPVPGTRILLPDGSTASPALSFLLDQDLGLYRSGSNDMRVSAGNTDTVEFRNTETKFDTVVKIKGPRPFADVTAYGAVGNGSTDDLAAIQAAIEAVTTEGGGDVFLPAGNYGISNQILIHSNISFLGAGQKVTTITCLSGFPAGRDCIHFGPNDSQNYTETGGGQYIEVKNMSLKCNNMPVGVGYGIAALGVSYCTIDHVEIYDTQAYGIIMAGTDSTTNVKSPLVQYCYFNNCGRNGGSDSLGGGNNQDARYLFNVFEACNGTAIDNVNVTRALWMGNHSIGNSHGKGSIWSDFGMTYSTIANNFIDNGSIHVYGLLGGGLAGAPTEVTIANNIIVNASSSAILVSPANQNPTDDGVVLDLKVIDNTIDNCDDVAINIGDAPGAVISGNVIRNWDVLNAGWEAIRLDSGVVSTIGTFKCLVYGNKLVSGNSTIWLKEAHSNGQAAQNQIYGNSAIGCSATLLATAPVSTLSSADTGIWIYNQNQQAPSFITASANAASTGILRVASTDSAVSFRNNANSGDISITKDSSDVLKWNGGAIVSSIIGTANQITATPSGNSVTLSTPQNIGTASSPTFASETLTNTTNQLILGTTRTVTLNAPTPATTSRTWTIPDISANGTFAALEAAQTFSGLNTFTAATTTLQNDSAKLNLLRPANSRAGYLAILNASGGLELHGGPNGGGEGGTEAFRFTTDSPSANTTVLSITGDGTTTHSGNIQFSSTSTQGIVGTTTNDSAASGNVGQYSSSSVTSASAVSAPGSSQFFDVTSISLTAGDWDVSVVLAGKDNGATISAATGGIGTATGNSSTGLIQGDNRLNFTPPTSTIGDVGISIPNYRVSITSTTTYYLKALFVYSAGTPQAYGRISARRVR